MYTPTFRTKKNGVPILSKDELDIIGERFVADFCPKAVQTPMEIDIDRFVCRHLGMKQDFQYLSHNGIYLGMTVFNDTDKIPIYDPEQGRADYISAEAGTIIIDNNLLDDKQEHRYRYTVGHESGHGILHPGYFGYNTDQMSMFDADYAPMITCRMESKGAVRTPPNQWTDKKRMEWQADFLSSTILMPKSMVLKLVDTLSARTSIWLPALYVYETSRTFNVSYEAAEYRLKHLECIPKDISIHYATFDFMDALDVAM